MLGSGTYLCMRFSFRAWQIAGELCLGRLELTLSPGYFPGRDNSKKMQGGQVLPTQKQVLRLPRCSESLILSLNNKAIGLL